MLELSTTIGALSEALASCQGDIRTATKNATNPHFRSKYADLEETIDCVKPHLAKHNLAFTQHPSYTDGIVFLTSFLSHSSGEWIKSTCSAPITKVDIQGVGSVITYLRRYSLQSIFLFAAMDDDGNSVSLAPENKTTPSVSVVSDTMKPQPKLGHNIKIG